MGVISRRSVLRGAGHAAAFGTLAAVLPRQLLAQEAGESAICLSMVYPNPGNEKFDEAAFTSGYLPLLKRTGGDSIERVELRLPKPRAASAAAGGSSRTGVDVPAPTPGNARYNGPPQTPAGPPPSRVLATVAVWIRDLQAFQARTATAGTQLGAELVKATTLQPALQYDQVLALLGEERSTIAVDGEVRSIYFPSKADGRFDAQYYGDKIIPMMVSLYGANSIQRIEFALGAKTNGAAPVLVGSAHYYIRDRAAFDAAGLKVSQQLAAEAPRYTNITPMSVDMKVVAIG